MGGTRVSADVTVVSAVWGDYMRFVPAWFEMVGRLDPQPREVIVATFPEHYEELAGYPCRIVFEDAPIPKGNYLIPWMMNLGGLAATSTWLSCVGMDDGLLSDGLMGLGTVSADIVSVSVLTTNGVYVQARGEQNLRAVSADMVLGPSFIRSGLFKQVGGYRTDVVLSDWMLWVEAYLAGGRLVTWDQPTHRIDIDSPGRFSSAEIPAAEYRLVRERMRAGLAAGVR